MSFGHAGTVVRVGTNPQDVPLLSSGDRRAVPANVSTAIRHATLPAPRGATVKRGRKITSDSARAVYMRALRKKGRTAAERENWERDHAFPVPMLGMFDLLRQAALYYAME